MRAVRALVFSLLACAAAAQEAAPEPGPLPPDLVAPGELVIPAQPGDATIALATFIEAHGKQKEGDVDAALAGYVRFLGMPGRLELPARYLGTVQARLPALLAPVRQRYDAALALYRKDRAHGDAELLALAEGYPYLPEGKAARTLYDSDRLRAAIDRARGLEDKAQAAKELEAAIHKCPAGLFRYEAMTLLKELGGPDLFPKGAPRKREPKKEGEAKPEDDPGLEVSDDG